MPNNKPKKCMACKWGKEKQNQKIFTSITKKKSSINEEAVTCSGKRGQIHYKDANFPCINLCF